MAEESKQGDERNALPAVRNNTNNTGEFIEGFGKNILLKSNLKERILRDIISNPKYNSETKEGPAFEAKFKGELKHGKVKKLLDQDHRLISKYLPADMVTDVIRANNVRKIVELLIYARTLQDALFSVFLDNFNNIEKLLKYKDLYIFQYLQQYESDKRKYKHYLDYIEKRKWSRTDRFGLSIPSTPNFNFTEHGHRIESQYQIWPSANTVNHIRVEPLYEILGSYGFYDIQIDPENPETLVTLKERQRIFREMREKKNVQLFTLPSEFFMGVLSRKTIEYLRFLKHMYDYLHFQIEKLENAKKVAMTFIFKYKNKDQINELIAMRERNLQEIANSYGFKSTNAVTIEAIAELMMVVPELRTDLLELIQPNRLPKIQDNIRHLRTMRQNAGRRKRRNKTKRRLSHM